MNNSFSLARTGMLIKKQCIENRRFYLISTLALLGLLAIIMLFWVLMAGRSYDEDTLYVAGLCGLLLTGSFFASTTFSMLEAKDKGIYWISFPASHSEKLLANLFFNVIVFTIVYVCCFFLLKTLVELYMDFLVHSKPDYYSYHQIDWNKVNGAGPYLPAFFSAFFVVQAAFILGSASFKRFSFILTTIIIAVFTFIIMWYQLKLIRGFIGDEYFSHNGFSISTFTNNGEMKDYEMNPHLKNGIEIFLSYLLAPFLWLITWFKLKEKQI